MSTSFHLKFAIYITKILDNIGKIVPCVNDRYSTPTDSYFSDTLYQLMTSIANITFLQNLRYRITHVPQ